MYDIRFIRSGTMYNLTVQKEDGREVKNPKIRQTIDRCLKDHGVDRGASHGGDFTGVACLILEDRIDDIIEEIESILLEYGNEKEEEIKQICKSYRLHFLLSSHNNFARGKSKRSCPRRFATTRVNTRCFRSNE